MKILLTSLEARIVGCLLEKETTTPDQYPLSLNSLVNACNQKSNREPVMTLRDADVQGALDSLAKRFLISDKAGFSGGRTTKYKHRFCNTEFGSLKFTPQERGLMCALLLRGAQTPGELRTHTQRLCDFADGGEVESVLARLMARDDGPFVARLPRAPGAREFRYMHQLSGEIDSVPDSPYTGATAEAGGTLSARVAQLETLVEGLRRDLDALLTASPSARD
jgi:uncharacterized protein YceH (UPF0502 family)